MRLKERKLAVHRPRLRRPGRGAGKEVPLPAYEALQEGEGLGARRLDILLRGVSTRQYQRVLPEMADTVGVSRSTYSSYELGFPAFPGQSGSPVFLDNLTPRARNKALGVVTKWISFRSEIQGDVSKASWAIGASLTPLSDWIKALPTE